MGAAATTQTGSRKVPPGTFRKAEIRIYLGAYAVHKVTTVDASPDAEGSCATSTDKDGGG